MRTIWRTVRNAWRSDDTAMLVATLFSLLLAIANSRWHRTSVAYGASVIPLVVLGAWALPPAHRRQRALLLRALMFGALCAAYWPIGEGVVVRLFGWWGRYLAPGIRLWDTALYCVLIGWLAFAYCAYIAWRIPEMGFSRRQAAVVTGLAAFGIGAIGENLFVMARMWEYSPSAFDMGYVPAFVPVAYGIGCSLIAYLKPWRIVPATLVFSLFLAVVCVSLGLLTGFFPR